MYKCCDAEMPKISVVTVCFNAAFFIENTMKSIWEQTYPSIEYIIVDGDSTDDTLLLIQKYSQCHFNSAQSSKSFYYLSEPDKGVFDAMNKAMQMATGEYILFIGAGDRFQDNHSIENILIEHNNADLLYSRAVCMQPDGEVQPWHLETPPPHRLSPQSFVRGMAICHPCMVVNRRCWQEYDLRYHVSADLDWAIRVVRQAKTRHFYDAVFCQYMTGGMSHKRRKNGSRERFAILKHHLGWLPAVWNSLTAVEPYG